MPNGTYGGVKGRKTKVGRKLLRFPPTRLYTNFYEILRMSNCLRESRSQGWEHDMSSRTLWHRLFERILRPRLHFIHGSGYGTTCGRKTDTGNLFHIRSHFIVISLTRKRRRLENLSHSEES